ncbi:hypothetical protein NM688_g5484 [Phlebia brevispora]|uniref:Uncharacterized protein n=1 Tax=Phlebia brevispora TaxID=194682 RepID=A0ACC1SUS7_9APHY|nr:hypothetical protein NM688_g5484 [Phlebia brevispora]
MGSALVERILYRRAARLRRVTGNQNLRSQGELDAAEMTFGDLAKTTLIRPFILSFHEPIVFFWNIYLALIYAIFYIFIESFRVVFIEHHHFDLGENGLAFLGIFIGGVVGYIFLVPFAIFYLKPKFANGPQNFIPESRLPMAMVGAFILPASMFWFGWTSYRAVHWIVPIIASGFFSLGSYFMFNSGLNYLPDCYPRYVASVLAGNDLFRGLVGAFFPLYSTAFFHNLGVGPACSLLGGVLLGMLPVPFVLYKYGARIRSWSKYAD